MFSLNLNVLFSCIKDHGEENGQGCAASYERSQHNLYEDEKNDWKMLTRFSKANGQVAVSFFSHLYFLTSFSF